MLPPNCFASYGKIVDSRRGPQHTACAGLHSKVYVASRTRWPRHHPPPRSPEKLVAFGPWLSARALAHVKMESEVAGVCSNGDRLICNEL